LTSSFLFLAINGALLGCYSAEVIGLDLRGQARLNVPGFPGIGVKPSVRPFVNNLLRNDYTTRRIIEANRPLDLRLSLDADVPLL